LKILLPGLEHEPGFAERFSREARALAKLSHPNIVAVHDFGESGGYFWLTMEYVDGVNLRQAMQAARFTPAQALALIPELCAALQFAHDHGVLHRDIKPENILLDPKGRVKVADFGIARMAGDERMDFTLTRTGSVLGSAAYVAPEQIERPHEVDHRADLYSLGVVLYEMLTGELPLGRFPAPSERSASDPRLDEVVFRTLEKEREKRFQSADELRSGVRDFDRVPGQGSSTVPRSRSEATTTVAAGFATGRIKRPARLRWVAVVAGLAVGILLLPMASYHFSKSPGSPGAAAVSPPPTAPATPQAAVEALLSAARDRDEKSFLAGMSRSFAAEVKKESDGSVFFGDFTRVTFARARQIDETTANVVMRMIDDPAREVGFEMVLEDGRWKLNKISR
jgi:serine/threonine protein kinase